MTNGTDDTTYDNAGSYQLRLNGAVLAPSGVSRVSVSSTAITFLFKSGRAVYNGSLPLRASSGTVELTKAFDLQVEGALLVYRNVTPATTGTAPAASDLSFRITSSKYTTFEIEGVGISDGTLYFSTNRSNDDGGFDGVHSFNDYVVG